MTTVTALLLALDRGTASRLDGLALPALVATSGTASLEAVFATRQPVEEGRWQAIVIDHSGSPFGTPASLEQEHRARNLRGLGFHFVVGNGNGLGDGEIHAGYRWLDQAAGAHTAGPEGEWYNRHAIGICVVGDGDRRAFTDAQMARLVDLVTALAREYNIPPDKIVLHNDVASTSGPGRFFPSASFREQVDAWR